MRKTILWLLILSCVLLVAKKTEEPEWLTNPKSLYPDTMYLSSLGEGDTRASAENDAAGNLSRVFESKIKVDQTYRERYKELTRGTATETEDISELNKNIGVQSQQTLYNIQFGESYTDGKGRVHVIAYLDRLRTGEIYSSKIEQNANQVSWYLDKKKSSNDPLTKYALQNAAIIVATNNQVLLEQLRIISPNMADFIDMPYDLTELQATLKEMGKSVRVSVTIKGDQDMKITNLLKEMLNEAGFGLADDGYLKVTGDIGYEKVDLGKSDEKFVRWEITLDLDTQKGDNLIHYYEKGREGHISYPEAMERSVREIEKKLSKQFIGKLNDYIDGLVMQ